MRYFVLAFLCLIAVISYVQRTGIGAVKGDICNDLAIDTEEFGILGSVWLVGYALMQVPAGWLADRFGGRNVLVALAIVWSLLTALLGWCPSFEIMLALWFVMGMALAGIFPCAAKSIGGWFPDTEKAMASGLLGSATMLGLAAASFLTSWLVFVEKLSWQATYVLYGGVGVLWAVVYLTTIPERHVSQTAKATAMSSADWRRLAASVPLWFLCGQQFFRAGAMIFFINWFPTFLKESRGFDAYDAGVNASRVGIAAMTGGILGGFFSDWLLRRTGLRWLSRQGIAIIGMTTAGVLVSVTYVLTDSLAAVVIFATAAFIASFGGVSGYTVAIEFGGKRIGIVFSMMNMAGNFGGAIVNYLAGSVTQRHGWDSALALFVCAFAIDAFCWAMLNPQGPLFADESPIEQETGIRAGEPPAPQGHKHESR